MLRLLLLNMLHLQPVTDTKDEYLFFFFGQVFFVGQGTVQEYILIEICNLFTKKNYSSWTWHSQYFRAPGGLRMSPACLLDSPSML